LNVGQISLQISEVNLRTIAMGMVGNQSYELDCIIGWPE
jgi:hypothetical protein